MVSKIGPFLETFGTGWDGFFVSIPLARAFEVLAMLCQWRRSVPEAEASAPLTLGRTIQVCWERAPGAGGRSLQGAIGNAFILARVRCHVTRASLARRLRAAVSRFRAQCLCNGQRLSARCRSCANSRAAWRIWRVASCSSCVQGAGTAARRLVDSCQIHRQVKLCARGGQMFAEQRARPSRVVAAVAAVAQRWRAPGWGMPTTIIVFRAQCYLLLAVRAVGMRQRSARVTLPAVLARRDAARDKRTRRDHAQTQAATMTFIAIVRGAAPFKNFGQETAPKVGPEMEHRIRRLASEECATQRKS